MMFSGGSYLPDEELMRSTLESQTRWWRLAYWGLFMLAFAVGIGVCCLFDKVTSRHSGIVCSAR